MSISPDPIPLIADMQSVRDLVSGITMTEYPDEKVTKSLMYGSSEVCNLTNKYIWDVGDKQYYRAIEAANYFAASNLIPKTIADRDSGMPIYVTFRKLGTEICNAINQGLPDDTSGEGDNITVKSTTSRNYYVNMGAAPFMGPEGFGGAYNGWNTGEDGTVPV